MTLVTEKPTMHQNVSGTPLSVVPPAATTATADSTPVPRPAATPSSVLSFLQTHSSAAQNQSPAAGAGSVLPVARQTSSVLPEGLKFTGKAFFPCDIQISGEVDGEVNTAPQKTITVTATGATKGELRATNVRIEGRASGLVKADGGLASFGEGARVSGEVVYGRISIAEGAEIEASMKKASPIAA